MAPWAPSKELTPPNSEAGPPGRETEPARPLRLRPAPPPPATSVFSFLLAFLNNNNNKKLINIIYIDINTFLDLILYIKKRVVLLGELSVRPKE